MKSREGSEKKERGREKGREGVTTKTMGRYTNMREGKGREGIKSRTEEAKRMAARRWMSSIYTTIREGQGIESMKSKTEEAKRMTVQRWMSSIYTSMCAAAQSPF